MTLRKDRRPNEMRPVKLTVGYNRWAEGSALIEWGGTVVLATVTIESRLPPHLRGKGGQQAGWLTAEYALLPRSTRERSARERLYAGGRTQEIQRLVGRSLRSVTNLALFPGKTLIVDLDVIQADGGTRCAAVVAGYAALHDAADRLVYAGEIAEWPLLRELGAVSVGIVGGHEHIDLEYSEDVVAEVDMNVVATGDGRIVEVQGGSEGEPITAEDYVSLLAMGVKGVERLVASVRPQLGGNGGSTG